MISSKYWNNGYTTEAVTSIINYLFDECNYSIIEAIIPSDNIGSIKVAEKCGMRIEAILKNRYKNKLSGRINNLLIYSIFNDKN